MAHLQGQERERFVKTTFREIAPNYRSMNHLMTLGMDIFLRKKLVRLARLSPNETLLDAGTGTGDLAREARRSQPNARIMAADYSWDMMTAHPDWNSIQRCAADALALPFSAESFNVVISGYLIRNVIHLETALIEQFRILKPGGRILILETTQIRRNIFRPLIKLYYQIGIPLLGKLFTGNRGAYTYLAQTSENFISAEDLAETLRSLGFSQVDLRVCMLGTMTIHSAIKEK